MSEDGRGYVERHSPYRGAFFSVHRSVGALANDAHGNELDATLRQLALKSRVSLGSAKEAIDQFVLDKFLEVLDPPTNRHPGKYRFLFPEAPIVFETRETVTPPARRTGGVQRSASEHRIGDQRSIQRSASEHSVQPVNTESAESETPPFVLKEAEEEPTNTAREDNPSTTSASQDPEPASTSASKRGTTGQRATAQGGPIPADWEPPPEELLKMSADCPLVDIAFETAQIIDWALSKGEKRADWVATWRTCLRRAQKRALEVAASGTRPAAPGQRHLSLASLPSDAEYEEAIARAEASENGWGV